MGRRTGIRFGIYIHDPYGDMGEGVISGTFRDVYIAEAKAKSLRRQAPNLECIVLPVVSGGDSNAEVLRHFG